MLMPIAATGINLDYVIKFEAINDYDSALASPYGSWIADYEITLSNDTTAALSGQYDSYSADWITLTDYDFKAGVPVKILEFAQLGKFTYADICNFVKSFKCGVEIFDAPANTYKTLSFTLTNRDRRKGCYR